MIEAASPPPSQLSKLKLSPKKRRSPLSGGREDDEKATPATTREFSSLWSSSARHKATPENAAAAKMWVAVEKWLDEFWLSPMATQGAKAWVKKMALPANKESMARVRQYIVHRISGRKRSPPPTHWHKPCPEILPGLRANLLEKGCMSDPAYH